MNMNFFSEKVMAVMLGIIFLGGGFLYWYNNIDGVWMNQTIVYRDGVDPLNLHTDKTTYKQGELVSFYSSFCKTRNATTVVQWTLVDGEQRFYSAKAGGNLPIGCYPLDTDSATTTAFRIETLFPDVTPGCDYHFVGTVVRDIGHNRQIVSNLKTTAFCVVKK